VERVRGEGLLLGVILQEPKAKQVELDCRQAGLLVNAIGDEVIRLAPPLNLTVEQADRATSILAEAIA
jgi:acetylornithine/succinyldiaminopimelate/putrescine aminotransferase